MGCGTKCCKVLLIIVNILFWIFGLGLLAVGVWVKVDSSIANIREALQVEDGGTDYVDIAAWVFIGAGIFAFIVGFIGCCGAIKESLCLLGFYIVCLVIIFAAEFSVAIFVGINFDGIGDTFTKYGSQYVKKYYDGKTATSKGFNYVQIKFCCCGIEDFRDYNGSKFVKDAGNQIESGAYMSFACCKSTADKVSDGTEYNPSDKQSCVNEAKNLSNSSNIEDEIKKTNCDSNFRAQGCKDKLIDWARENFPIFIGLGAGVAFVQIFIFISAVCMCHGLRIEKD